MKNNAPTPQRRNTATPWMRRRRFMLLCCFVALWGWGVPAFAVTPATLVGPDLQPQPIHLTSIRDGRIGYFDQNRELRNAPLSDFVQLRGFVVGGPAEDFDPAKSDRAKGLIPGTRLPNEDNEQAPVLVSGMIELIDGTRLSGRLEAIAEDGQSLRWLNEAIGAIDVTLEDLAALALRGPLPRLAQPAADRAVLINGDTVEGFLEKLVAVRVGNADALVEVPLDRLAQVALSNPRTVPAIDHVQLSDGSRIGAQTLVIEGDALQAKLTLPSGTREATWPLQAVRRIDLSQSGQALEPLWEQSMRIAAGGEVFGVTWRPRVEDEAILLHAPVTVEFDLPPGTSRFAAKAELALEDVPMHARAWADCVLTVRVDGSEPRQFHLRAEAPSAMINLPIGGSRLTIEVASGEHGPLLDRVRLVDAMVLVRTSPK